MKNIYFALIFVIALAFNSYGQLNEYKYVIIPKTLSSFKKVNQYQTSTYLKYLFEQNGFNAVYDDVLPEDLDANVCLALKANLEVKPSLFNTKLRIVVKDCRDMVVFTSIEGKSREKDYKPAYVEAIKQAFTSYQELNYKYIPIEKTEDKTITLSFKNDVKKLPSETSVAKKSEDASMKQQVLKKNSTPKSDTAESSMKVMDNNKRIILTKQLELLYAQPIENGFQLVDSTPKVRFKLTETSVENVFLATRDNTNGVVLNKNGAWFFEYTADGKKVLEELNIKF